MGSQLNPWWLVEDYMWCGQLPVYIVTHIADKTEMRNIDELSMLIVNRDHFIFFAEGLVLAFFILFSFFELLTEVALAIAVHHRAVLIDAKFRNDLLFIHLIVGT